MKMEKKYKKKHSKKNALTTTTVCFVVWFEYIESKGGGGVYIVYILRVDVMWWEVA